MLPYALAIAVGVSSSILFVTAFLFKDIHRQDDFFWSGVGLFYALVLWFCATSITGAVLLGQMAVVALLTAYFWQVIKLRKAISNPEAKESLDNFSVVGFFQNLFKRKSPSATVAKTQAETQPKVKVTTDNQQTNKNLVNSTSFPPTVVTTETTNPVSTTDTQANTSLQKTPPSTNIKSNEVLDAQEPENNTENKLETATNPVATPPPIAKETSIPETPEEIKTSPSEVIKSETPEIPIETVTIVEEESNWDDEDDEVEDIPTSSIKVIKEVLPTDERKKNEE